MSSHTWTYHDTIDNLGTWYDDWDEEDETVEFVLGIRGTYSGNYFFFIGGAAYGADGLGRGHYVFRYDAVNKTNTDISGSTFEGNYAGAIDLLYWNSTLYALATDDDGDANIYSWNGGTSWTEESQLAAGAYDTVQTRYQSMLDGDSSRMLAYADEKFYQSVDGSTWNQITVDGSSSYTAQLKVFGQKKSEDDTLTAIARVSGTDYFVKYSSGVNWITGNEIGGSGDVPGGLLSDQSFHRVNVPPFTLYRATGWDEPDSVCSNAPTGGSVYGDLIQFLHYSARLYLRGGTRTEYWYDPNIGDISTDTATIGSAGTLQEYFRNGDSLYAVLTTATPGEMDIYTAGELPEEEPHNQLYIGILEEDSLEYVSELPWPLNLPTCLAVRTDGAMLIGAGADTESNDYIRLGWKSDNYQTWHQFSEGYTDTLVKALAFISEPSTGVIS